MFHHNRNNENVAFNSDGRINELPDEDEEQVNEDLRNEGVTQEQLDFLELQKLKNRIKADRGLGTKDANNNRAIRLGYQNNEYYMSSYNNAKANRQGASSLQLDQIQQQEQQEQDQAHHQDLYHQEDHQEEEID